MKTLLKIGLASIAVGTVLSMTAPAFASDIVYVNSENVWQYVNDAGMPDNKYNGITNNKNGWWYVKNGKVDLNYTGFAKNENGWWYIENGKVTFNKNDVIHGTVNGTNAWWNVKGSKVLFNESIEQNRNGWWYIKNGKVDFGYTGIKNNVNGWWYVKNGKVDFNYTGFAKNENGWWYIENGKVTFNKNDVIHGTVNGTNAWWNVKGSKVLFNESIEQNRNGWWYIKNGKVDFGYTGIKNNVNGWWYVKNGKVDFSYTGFAKNENGWWYIENGKVTFNKNDVIQGTVNGVNAWWNVKGSKVLFNESVEQNRNGWWYIKNGKVDFSYTGWASNKNGTWYIKNGKVDFNVKSGKKVVIDPGHQAKGNYGTEPLGPGSSQLKTKVSSGTQGVSTGVPEYKLVLTVSLKLKEELKARGYTVIMTRESNDVNISNAERANIANNNNADAFVRVHANSSNNSSQYGALTMCQTKNNPYNKNIYSQSYKLSKLVLDEYCKSTGAKSVMIWETDTMTGINWSKVPVTCIELGYMSNPSEDKRMQDSSYQNKMVKGIANGIDMFFK